LVAKCEGGFDLHQRLDWHNKPWAFFLRDDEDPERVDKFYLSEYEPSTNWAQGGPLINQMLVDGLQLKRNEYPRGEGTEFVASLPTPARFNFGPTPLIAALRCHVVSKLGVTVEIPEEL
jgi:hypothetical protein